MLYQILFSMFFQVLIISPFAKYLGQAEAGGSGVVSRRFTGQTGSDSFVTKIPNNKVIRKICICHRTTLSVSLTMV